MPESLASFDPNREENLCHTGISSGETQEAAANVNNTDQSNILGVQNGHYVMTTPALTCFNFACHFRRSRGLTDDLQGTSFAPKRLQGRLPRITGRPVATFRAHFCIKTFRRLMFPILCQFTLPLF